VEDPQQKGVAALDDRKIIERAKGILMKCAGFG
jgi:AmiR/NasT family two-component response regulator